MFRTSYDAETRTWYGRPTVSMYHPNVSVAQVVLDALQRRPHHIGQVSDGGSGIRLSNRTLRLNAIRTAEHLSLMGIGTDDVVALVAKNHHHVAAVVIASMSLAAPINTLDPNFTSDEIVHMLRLTQPKVLFCDADNIDRVRQSLAELDSVVPIFTFDRKVDGARLVDDLMHETGTENDFLPAVLEDGTKQAAAIICSSGTTGAPKGVSLSHAALLSQMPKVFALESDDVLLCFSSLYWISGLACLMAGLLQGITRIISTAPFSPVAFVRCVSKFRVSVCITATSHLAGLLSLPPHQLAGADFSSLMRYYVAGGSLAPELALRINAYLPADVRNVYGMSEIVGKIACTTDQMSVDSVGMLVDGLRVRILACTEDAVDEQTADETEVDGGDDAAADEADGDGDDGVPLDQRCEVGVPGEICVQMLPPFIGYWNDAAATKLAFTKDGQWFRTGDIGRFDDDGRLYVIDRKKDLLKYDGVQVSPTELESLVLTLPGVAAVCVVGVPDALAGDLPAAVVVRTTASATAGSDNDGDDGNDIDESVVTEADVCAIVEAHLSDAKRLRGGVYFADTLPATHSGKVLRRKVRDMVIEWFNASRMAELEDE